MSAICTRVINPSGYIIYKRTIMANDLLLVYKLCVLCACIYRSNILTCFQVLGFCVPDKPYDGDGDTTVVMVTELGEPIDLIKLLQMSWEDRLRVCSALPWLERDSAFSPSILTTAPPNLFLSFLLSDIFWQFLDNFTPVHLKHSAKMCCLQSVFLCAPMSVFVQS